MAIIIAVVSTLVAAFLNALSSILQRKAAGKPDPKMLFHKHLIKAMIRSRVWISGLILQIIAAVLQGVALYQASLVLVEPLLTTDLIFLMLLLHFRFNMRAGRREWGAVAALCGGLSMLLAAANPRGGHLLFNGLNWALTAGLIGGVVAVSAVIMRRSDSPSLRAGIGGIAAGLNFALTAGFAKLMLGQLQYGVGNVFSSWELYAMAASGAVSLVVAQSTFAAGPLAISQPAIEISDPLVSGLIGILLFGDMISTSAPALTLEVIGALAAVAGIVLLGGSRRVHESEV